MLREVKLKTPRYTLRRFALATLMVLILSTSIGTWLVANVGAAFAVAPTGSHMIGGPVSPLNPATCGLEWRMANGPDPGPGNDYLRDVAVVTPDDIWAVGDRGGTTTLTEHWNGVQWTVVPSSNGFLQAVTAVSTNDVWAVGYFVTFPNRTTLITHWNGLTWDIVSSPNVPSAPNELANVAAISANDIWAVGYVGNLPNEQTLTLHYDGTSWTRISSPNLGPQSNGLRAITAISTNDVWVAGFYYEGNYSTPFHTLIEHWNGTNWSIVPSPDPAATQAQIVGLSAVSANDVWAVGGLRAVPGPYRTLIKHWNGSTWSVVPSPTWAQGTTSSGT